MNKAQINIEKLKLSIPFWWLFNDTRYPLLGCVVFFIIDVVVIGSILVVGGVFR